MSMVQARRRPALITRWLGALGGVVLAVLLVPSWGGWAMPLIGAFCGWAVLVGVLLGEVGLPGFRREPARRASLRPRRVLDHLPPSSRIVAVLLGAQLAVVGLIMARPSTPIPGVSGRVVTTCDRVLIGVIMAWPEPAVVLPALMLTMLGIGTAAGALALLVRRPRPGGTTAEDDDRRRREAVAAVVGAIVVLVAAAFGGTALTAGVALVNGCGGAVSKQLGWLLVLAAGAAAALGLRELVGLLARRRSA
jgi:hypothetical protein